MSDTAQCSLSLRPLRELYLSSSRSRCKYLYMYTVQVCLPFYRDGITPTRRKCRLSEAVRVGKSRSEAVTRFYIPSNQDVNTIRILVWLLLSV